MNILTTLAYEILSEHGYPAVRIEEDEGGIRSHINLDSGIYRFEFTPGHEGQSFSLTVLLPEKVPEAKRWAVMDYLTRINYRLSLGHFIMNPDDGEVRFTHGQLTLGKSLEAELLLTLMRFSLGAVETWFPGMLRIIHGHRHPEAMIAEIEESFGFSSFTERYLSQRLN